MAKGKATSGLAGIGKAQQTVSPFGLGGISVVSKTNKLGKDQSPQGAKLS